MKPIIEIEGIGKRYQIGASKEPYLSIRDELAKKFSPKHRREMAERGDFWALKDVSFSVNEGEAVGIIGRNGAGKSTLLKVLSQITPPTEGKITLRGRIASLLEVGTGFHPELTGRENIFLNGAILGMTRREIQQKFDDIVAFAEVEKFLDTPVKRYSSGMYVRLAFAVAAHLEPEILVVDEVLAVGDAEFQKKCLGKMGEVARGGRTVLFVSHNMAAIKTFCQRAILLRNGEVAYVGGVNSTINNYMNFGGNNIVSSRSLVSIVRTKGSGRIRITDVSLKTQSEELRSTFAVWEPIIVEVGYLSADVPIHASFWFMVSSVSGTTVLSSFQFDTVEECVVRKNCGQVRVLLDPVGLVPGQYSLSTGIFGQHLEFYDWVDNAISFEISRECAHNGKPFDNRLGETTQLYKWEVE